MDLRQLPMGIGFTVHGAHLLVDGGLTIAKRFKIATLVIGSTIVALGTSKPELTININSALHGRNDLAMGNVLGNNLCDLGAIPGLLGLVFSGEFIVDGATGIARRLGLPDRVSVLVIVGPGTSLPELIASIVAALRKQVGMVIGHVFGSNIFNVFITPGARTLIKPLPLGFGVEYGHCHQRGPNALLLMHVGLSRRKTIDPRFQGPSGGHLHRLYRQFADGLTTPAVMHGLFKTPWGHRP
jgi:Ca2+/Na+ antiporter